MKIPSASIFALAVLFSTAPNWALAESCDQICAQAGEPGYNHATGADGDAVCCCQVDPQSGIQVNRPASECEGVNPESPAEPAED